MKSCNRYNRWAREGAFVLLMMVLYAVYTYLLRTQVPYWSDDILYRYIDMWGCTRPVESVGDIVASQWSHWHEVNGRSIVHGLLQLLLLVSPGKVLFNILDALVWCLMAWMVMRTASQGRRTQGVVCVVTLVGLRFFMPEGYVIYNWAAGSLNYVWVAAAVLGYMLLYERLRERRLRWIWLAGVGVLSVLVGWSHEAVNCGLLVALAVDAVRHRRTVTPTAWVMVAGVGVGLVMMLIAPGNYAKLDSIYTQPVQHLIRAGYNLTAIPLSWVMIAVTLVVWWRRRAWCRTFVDRRLNYFIVWAVSLAFSCVVGSTGRATFFVELMALVLLMSYIAAWATLHKGRRLTIATAVVTVGLCCYEGFVAADMHRIYGEFNATLTRMYSGENDYTTYRPIEPRTGAVMAVEELCCIYEVPATPQYTPCLRFVPQPVVDAIAAGTLVCDENRLAEGLPFYTTADISCLVMPCDSAAGDVEYLYRLYPASLQDPNLSVMGMLRRLIAPASLPTIIEAEGMGGEPGQPYEVGGSMYVILRKPQFQRVMAVECNPKDKA